MKKILILVFAVILVCMTFIIGRAAGNANDASKELTVEQIGGRIFIDPWGLVAPGGPGLVTEYVEKAAGVSYSLFSPCCTTVAIFP